MTAQAYRAGWIDDTSISTGATQAVIYSHPTAIVAAIRGSDRHDDWRYNLASVIRRPWKDYIPKGRVDTVAPVVGATFSIGGLRE